MRIARSLASVRVRVPVLGKRAVGAESERGAVAWARRYSRPMDRAGTLLLRRLVVAATVVAGCRGEGREPPVEVGARRVFKSVALAECGDPGGADTGEAERTGFVQCLYPERHRVAAVACPEGVAARGVERARCRADADCTRKPGGHCLQPDVSGVGTCGYGCREDSDCLANEACSCRSPEGACVRADCRTDADCEAGLCEIAAMGPPDVGWQQVFACTSPADACHRDSDCAQRESCIVRAGGRQCVANPSRDLTPTGRPMSIAGAWRLARLFGASTTWSTAGRG